MVFKPLTADEFAAKCRLPGLEGQIYREVVRIRDAYRDEITAAIPRTGAGWPATTSTSW